MDTALQEKTASIARGCHPPQAIDTEIPGTCAHSAFETLTPEAAVLPLAVSGASHHLLPQVNHFLCGWTIVAWQLTVFCLLADL